MSLQTEAQLKPEPPPFPAIKDVKMFAPLGWLSLAWADLRACPIPSLFYGFCFAAMGLLITFVFEHAYEYTSGLTSGFLLLGPFLAMGLYEISRRRELGEACALGPTLTVWRRNISNLALFAIVLGVVFLVWARASLVVFALFYTNELPNLSGFLEQVLAFENLEFLLVYLGVGLLFASIVFACSVVSIPLMLDRNQDAISAMLGSVIALARNPASMTVWALMIVTFTVLGFLTFHIGLVILMPLIGHASWHAYREIILPLEQTPKDAP